MDIAIIVRSLYMLIPGLILLVWFKKAQATKKWATTEGTIISSKLDEKWGDAEYEYYVNGERLTSNRIYFGQHTFRFMDRFYRPSRGDSYAPETQVTVYYDTNNPRRSVLQPGYPEYFGNRYVTIGAIAIALIGGIVFLALALII